MQQKSKACEPHSFAKSEMFCNTNNDCVCFEDASLVYVRDRHGVLTSPPGYEKSRTRDGLRERDTVYGNLIYTRMQERERSPT